jgi:acetylglutamate kinase
MVQRIYNSVWCNPSNNKNKKLENTTINNATLIKSVLKQAVLIKNQNIVIKLSDIIVADRELLTNFAENIHILCTSGSRIFIVHEYERIVKTKLQEMSDTHGNNYSYFSQNNLAELIEMIISGRINRDIITKLCKHEVQAVGLSGKDNNSIIAKKANTAKNSYKGEPLLVNPEILLTNDSNNIVSVISPIACNEKGRTVILDTNLTASMIAASIGADHLIMLEEDNYLTKNDITISSISELNNLLDNNDELHHIISELDATKYALQHAGCLVRFFSARTKDILLLKLFT